MWCHYCAFLNLLDEEVAAKRRVESLALGLQSIDLLRAGNKLLHLEL